MGRCGRPLIQTCACLLFLCCCLRASPPALSPPPPSSPSRNPFAQKPFRSYPYSYLYQRLLLCKRPPVSAPRSRDEARPVFAPRYPVSRISPSSRLHPRISRIPYPIIPYPQDTRTPLSRIVGATRNLVILYSHPPGRGAPLRWDA